MFLTEYFTSLRVPDSATCHLRTPPPLPPSTHYPAIHFPWHCLEPSKRHPKPKPRFLLQVPFLVKLHRNMMLYLLMGNCALNGPTSGQHELSANVEKPFKENAEGLQNMLIKGKPCLGMLGILINNRMAYLSHWTERGCITSRAFQKITICLYRNWKKP